MSDNDEVIVSSEQIYDGRVVKLSVAQVTLPDGTTAKREIIHHPGAVAMVAMTDDDEILLVRQYRTAAGKSLLEVPAGTLEPGEDPAFCAVRELQEETGYKPGHLSELGGIYVAPGYTTEYIHLFFATSLTESRLEADSDEFIEVVKVSLYDAVKMIERGEICDGKSVSALLRVYML